jgi:hypothetical protein
MEKIIAGAFSLLIGVVGIWTGFRQLRNRSILNRWNTTKGKVIERSVYQPNIATLSVSGFRWSPLIKYAYHVDGKEFVNDCIHPKRIQAVQHSSKKWAQKRMESFADEVTVHYNPEDPSESFLIQTPKSTLWIVIAASCFALLVGLLFFLAR